MGGPPLAQTGGELGQQSWPSLAVPPMHCRTYNAPVYMAAYPTGHVVVPGTVKTTPPPAGPAGPVGPGAPGWPCGPGSPMSPLSPFGPCSPRATGSICVSLRLHLSRSFTVADRVLQSTAALAEAEIATHATTAIHLHPIHRLLAAPSLRDFPVALAPSITDAWRCARLMRVGHGERDEHGTPDAGRAGRDTRRKCAVLSYQLASRSPLASPGAGAAACAEAGKVPRRRAAPGSARPPFALPNVHKGVPPRLQKPAANADTQRVEAGEG